MLVALRERAPSIRDVGDVLAVCKKLIPILRQETPDAQLQKELERLALSAPHLLADIGFERDLKACSCETRVWRRGAHCVITFGTNQAAPIAEGLFAQAIANRAFRANTTSFVWALQTKYPG